MCLAALGATRTRGTNDWYHGSSMVAIVVKEGLGRELRRGVGGVAATAVSASIALLPSLRLPYVGCSRKKSSNFSAIKQIAMKLALGTPRLCAMGVNRATRYRPEVPQTAMPAPYRNRGGAPHNLRGSDQPNIDRSAS